MGIDINSVIFTVNRSHCYLKYPVRLTSPEHKLRLTKMHLLVSNFNRNVQYGRIICHITLTKAIT